MLLVFIFITITLRKRFKQFSHIFQRVKVGNFSARLQGINCVVHTHLMSSVSQESARYKVRKIILV